MVALSLFSALAFSLASLVIGIRLLVLARSTRQLPELLMGFSFLCGGVIGHSIAYAARMFPPETHGAELVLALLGRFFVGVGCATTAVAAWRIFRQEARWAGILAGVLIALLLSYVLRDQLLGSVDRQAALRHPLYWIGLLATAATYGWMSWESFQRQRMLRRQRRHGFGGNPLLASRILFWSIGTGSIALLFLTLPVLRVVEHALQLPPLGRVVIAIMGLICAASMWIAFFPPGLLIRRLERVDRTAEAT